MTTTLAPPPTDPRRRRHAMTTVSLARRLSDGGWTPTQIRRYLAEQGVDVALNTVRTWVDEGYAESHRAQNSASYRRRTQGRPAAATPLLDRMLELRAAGCSLASIAAVIRLDYGVQLTADQVRYYLRCRREPRRPARMSRS